MKCRRVEKLIPLYVERDLESGIADRISSHLDWCGRCNWLADEYRESQSWLRSSPAPEFDEAALNLFKAGVLSRIAETSAKPSLIATLLQHLNRRQVLALSTAVLVVLGMVVLYVYQMRARLGSATPQIVDSRPSIEPGPAGIEENPREANSDKRRDSPKRRIYRSARNSGNALARRPAAQTDAKDRAPVVRASLSTVNSSGFGASPAILRIEIQTSDPNIRIIWFAPKETDSHQIKPATD